MAAFCLRSISVSVLTIGRGAIASLRSETLRSEGDGPLSKSGLPEHSGASGIGASAVRGLRSCASCSMPCSVLGLVNSLT